MGIFGAVFGKKGSGQPDDLARPPYYTPGYGGPMTEQGGPMVEQGAGMDRGHSDPSRRLFGDGSVGGIVGGVGKLLMYGPWVGSAQEGINRRRDHYAVEDDYKRAQIEHLGQPEKTPMQRNIEYLRSIGRDDLADSYMRAEANPQALMTNPATGQLGFYPKGGMPGVPPVPGATPSPKSQQEYDALPPGTAYIGSDGQTRVKG